MVKIGRNDPCPCGSEKKYKKCCLGKKDLPLDWIRIGFLYIPKNNVPEYFKKDNSPMRHIKVYVSYQELYENTPYRNNNENILREEIRGFNCENYILTIAKLHYLFSDFYRENNSKEVEYARELLPDISTKIIDDLWERDRKFFTRQQMLSLMKIAILEKGNGSLVKDNLSIFSRTLFRITDLMEPKFPADINGYLLRNYYFNHIENPAHSYPRYWILYTECFEEAKKKKPKESFPIEKKFQEITGLDLKLFIFLTFGLLAHYFPSKLELIKEPEKFIISEQYFRNLKEDIQKQAKKIFLILSASIDEFKSQIEEKEGYGKKGFYYSFSVFWEKSLLKLAENKYILIDKEYLQEKATHGIYYLLLDGLKREGVKKINKLNAFIGRCFEFYVRKLLTRIYPNSAVLTKRVFCDIDGDNTGGVDFIVCYPDSSVLFEVTTSAIPHKILLSGDMAKIEEKIQNIFFSTANRRSKGKIYQLNNGISVIKKGNLYKFTVPPDKLKIYPVLVMEKFFPWVPPVVELCQKCIREKGLLSGYIENFMILDIEELELLEEVINSCGQTFPQIFEEYKASEYKNWSFKNFLYYKKSDVSLKNFYLLKQFRKMRDLFSKEYFK